MVSAGCETSTSYHRQVPGTAVVVVRNTFLDIAREDAKCKRSRSAPADLARVPHSCKSLDAADLETDIDDQSVISFGDQHSSASGSPSTCALPSTLLLPAKSAGSTISAYGGNKNWLLPAAAWPLSSSSSNGEADAESDSEAAGESDSPRSISSFSPPVLLPVQASPGTPCLQRVATQGPSPASSTQASCDSGPGAADDVSSAKGILPPPVNTVTHTVVAASGVHRFVWTVDAGRLQTHQKQAISPTFEMPLAKKATATMVILPKPSEPSKTSSSFRKSQGWGSLHLKCEALEGAVVCMFSVTDGTASFAKQPRGPVRHDFATSATCSLPQGQEQWHLHEAVYKASKTFSVCLDILPCTAGER